MRNAIKIIFFLIGMCIYAYMQAQPFYVFSNYTADDGLSETGINDILQDKRGFLWLATMDGLIRFDGCTFYNYKDKLNLSNSVVNRIIRIEEDSLGYLWMLGYNNKIIRFDPRTEKCMPVLEEGYRVQNFYILSDGCSWFSTNKGLIIIKGKPDDTDLEVRNISEKLQLPYNTGLIKKVQSDGEGNNWILTTQGIYMYSFAQDTIINPFREKYSCSSMIDCRDYLYFAVEKGGVLKYNKEDSNYELLQLNTRSQVTALCAIQDNELFCGTREDGFFIISSGGKEKKHYTESGLLPDNWIKNVYKDSDQNLWIHQKTVGVTFYDTKEDKIYRFNIRDKSGKVLTDGRQKQMVVEDSQGNIFVHPVGGGLGYFDKESRKLVPFYNRQLMDGWGESDMIMTVYADRQGNIWLSSNVNGLEKITASKKVFSFYVPENLRGEQIDSRAAFIDRNNRLWVGFRHKGIGLYEADTHQFIGYLQKDGTVSKERSQLLPKAYVITQDHEGIIWIGTKAHGVMRLCEKKRKGYFELESYVYNANDVYSLSNNDVFHIYEDNAKRLWFLTLNGGINYLEQGAGGTVRFINYRNQLTTYPIDACFKTRSIISDKKGHLWLATGNGVLVFNEKFVYPSEVNFMHLRHIPADKNSLNNNDIQSICLTSRNEIYLTSFGGGLSKLMSYENGKARFKDYTQKDGLLSNILYGIQEDREGNLWIPMMDGLCKFNPSTEEIENYSEHDFPANVKFNEGIGYYYASCNLLIFNTLQGPLCFNPTEIHKSSFCPAIVFTGLKVNDSVVCPQDDTGILACNIDDTPLVELSHLQNSFAVQFAALDMNGNHRLRYKYRLKGFEESWNSPGAGSVHLANYTNLPKGDYVLEVLSTNSDGVWVNNLRQLPVRILPSFWETPWAFCLYFLILLGIIALIVYILFTFYRLKHKVKVERELAELKLHFFTTFSHELRTPLTLIAGPVKNILDSRELPEEVRTQLRMVDRNANKMTNLINQILDFRKLQHHKMKLRVQHIELIPFIRSMMECFQALAEAHQINFVLENEISDSVLWADSEQLERILFNLLSNAFKYTPVGKTVRVKVEERESEILIEIINEGSVIPESKQKVLFERFETLSIGNIWNQASTGIGLSLVKELMNLHKGSVSVRSNAEEGTVFILCFKKGKAHFDIDTEFILADGRMPRTYNWDEGELELDEAVESVGSGTENLPTMLIVEDNKELRDFLKIAFQKEFNIVEAIDGEEGLIKARDYMPDMIISDIMMPQKDGIELLRDLRSDVTVSHIPVILLTAKSTVENRIEGIELGADDYLSKPFSINYLKVRIMNILEQRKRLQEYYCSAPSDLRETMLAEAQQTLVDTITNNDQLFMKRLLDGIYKYLDKGDLKIEELSQEIGMNRAVFFNKVKNLTGLAPVEFLKEVRLKQAAKLMVSTDLNVSQIAFQVGFNDAHYFSKCFKRQFGVTPSAYQRREKGDKRE